MKIKKLVCLLMVISMLFSVLATGFVAQAAEVELSDVSVNTDIGDTGAETEIAETDANLYGLADNIQEGQILQCWCWSYNNITNNLQKIAEQGFTAIQTSPIQPIKESTKEYYNTIMNSSWVVYQPVAFNIEDNYRNAQGTKKEFKAMCEKAHKYGIKVIVDVVFNHTANDMSSNSIHPWVPDEIRNNSDCWHDISKNISNYDNRYETTQYCLTGLPDLNTSNSIVQKHCINLLKEAIDAGADGFRFDAVKHIETPKDSSSIRSNFWPNVLNEATAYAQETRDFTPYYYGELLGSPGGSLSISAYTQYMSISDSGSSDSIRNGVCNGKASAAASGTISNGAAKNKTVQWTESHDNHKDNGTADISEHNINKTWAIIGAKKEVCGLYLARPEDMNTTMMGDADQTSWTYPEVKAVNRFKNAFVGQSEYLSYYNKLACVERGTSGMIIVNTGGSYYDGVKVPVHKIANGTYKDAITGNTFTVSGGYIKGDIGDTGIAVVYNADSTGAFTEAKVTDFAIAGTFNKWSTTSHKMVAKDVNKASVTMFLNKGTYTFKVTANDLWYGNKGTINDTTGETGWTMKSYIDNNCTLVASGGKYTFTFDITTGKLVVEYENTSDKTSDVYLKGNFNDWADTNPMTYVDNTNTVKASVNLAAGTYTFKIHNTLMDAWYGNTGTINDTTGDNGWTMSPDESTKCTLKASGGKYIFTYDLSTNKITVEPVTTTYQVTFTDWDGTVLKTEKVLQGDAATAPAAPQRESTAQYTYTFTGWSRDFSNVTGDITVTAKYSQTVNKYTVTFVDEDGSVLSTQTVAYGSAATAPAAPKRESTPQYSFVFMGWSREFSNVTEDITVTAKYARVVNKYTVTFVDADGSVLSTQKVAYGSAATAPAEPSRDGYVFSGWDKEFSAITEETVVTATYTEEEKTFYTVIFKDWDGTELSTQQVEEGTSATAPAKPSREGYTFKAWDNDFTNVTEDIVVTATYTKIQTVTSGIVKVEMSGGNGFKIAFNDGNARAQGAAYLNSKVSVGTKVTVTANAIDGMEFLGWYNPDSNVAYSLDNTYTFTATGNDYLKAMYTVKVEDVQLVVFKNDKAAGGNGRVLDMQYYAPEDDIYFPEDPSQVGYDFAGWSMTEDEIKTAVAGGQSVTVVAEWTRQIVYVNVTVIDGTGGGLVAANAATTVTANAPAEGMKFAYWEDAAGNIKSYNETYKLYPSTDVTVKAVYVTEDTVVDYQILVSVDTVDTSTADNVFYYSWYVHEDENVTFVDAGILAINKDFYDESKFYVGSGLANMYDRGPSAEKDMIPVHTYTWKKTNVPDGQTWIAKAYVQYRDASGQLHTVYSDIVEVTKGSAVTANYTLARTTSAGVVKVEIVGGNGFRVALDDGKVRPQGASYLNSGVVVGTKVTVTANTIDGMEFLGWYNPYSNVAYSLDYTYTFTATGNDYLKAMYAVPVEDVQHVIFKNDKAAGGNGRILDMQYYAAGDGISFPDDASQVGYDFAGWSMTEDEIKTLVAGGQSVTVVAEWTRQIVYVNVTVIDGTGGGLVAANAATTVTANAPAEGMKFAYWEDAAGNIKSYNETYKLYPSTDVTVKAVYVTEDTVVDYQILVSVDTVDTSTADNVFYYSWYVHEDENVTFVDAGILAINKDFYDESKFYVGSGLANMYDRGPSAAKDMIPVHTYTWKKTNVPDGQTWIAKAYVQYRDASGQLHTVYSDIVEVTK